MSSPSDWRALLSSRLGALLQVAAFGLAGLMLSSSTWYSPLILAMLAGTFIWLAGDNWPEIGFRPPRHRLIWWAPAAVVIGVLWQYAAVGALAPVIGAWLPGSTGATGPPGIVLAALLLVGLHPLAKGVAYRGFLLSRLERLFGQSRFGRSLAFVLASLMFGLGNRHQGWAGIALGALTGAVLNALYYWEGRSVWPTFLAHAAFNAAALSLLYLGGI